jgi:preprotein translocase subunit SecA
MSAIATRLRLPEDTPLDSKLLSGSIENAQKRIEANNFARRKHVLTYDDVMNQQRKIIYQERAEVLFNDDISEKIKAMITDTVTEAFEKYFGEGYDFDGFRNHFRGALTDSRGFNYSDEELEEIDKDALLSELLEKAHKIYESKDALYSKIPEVRPDAMREIEKQILLRHVDSKWMDHLEAMDDIKEYVGLNSYAQRDPVAMYRLESANLFDEMIHDIKEDTVRDILAHVPVVRIKKRAQLIKPVTDNSDGAGAERKPATSNKVGRNDPCPCGSGKKYKKCHGINEN